MHPLLRYHANEFVSHSVSLSNIEWPWFQEKESKEKLQNKDKRIFENIVGRMLERLVDLLCHIWRLWLDI